MRGNHLYHKDVYDLVRAWTSRNNNLDGSEHKCEDCCECAMLPDLDEGHSMLKPICPSVLVEIARICNPF